MWLRHQQWVLNWKFLRELNCKPIFEQVTPFRSSGKKGKCLGAELPPLGSDMEFVQKFTPPDFQAKNFTPSISPNFNSFSGKKTQKMSENGEIYTAGKNFTLPPAVTARTNSTSASQIIISLCNVQTIWPVVWVDEGADATQENLDLLKSMLVRPRS